ncbi:hypothetical protein PisoF_02642 [Pseudomonas sp. IsoF]|nr:hypothetical protein PisoF_02642 [Pseudomonas sp. IsoF]
MRRERAAQQPQDLSVQAKIAGAAAQPFPTGPAPRQGRSYTGEPQARCRWLSQNPEGSCIGCPISSALRQS